MTTAIYMRTDKAAQEALFTRLLCETISEMPSFEIEPLAPPEPDVLVRVGDRQIGIEVTEIHGNPRLRMIEGEQDKALAHAGRIWKERDLPPVAVWIHWLPTLWPRRLDREIAPRLVDLLAAQLPSRPGVLEIDSDELTAALGDPCVEHVFLYTDWEYPSEWNWARRWNGGTVGRDLIQREIDRKSSKPSQYTSAFTERWLLLVHGGGTPSSGFDLSPDISQHSFLSPFDRVYVLSLIGPKVRQLALKSRSPVI